VKVKENLEVPRVRGYSQQEFVAAVYQERVDRRVIPDINSDVQWVEEGTVRRAQSSTFVYSGSDEENDTTGTRVGKHSGTARNPDTSGVWREQRCLAGTGMWCGESISLRRKRRRSSSRRYVQGRKYTGCGRARVE